MERRKPKKDKNENPFSFRTFLTTASSNGDSSIAHAHVSNPPENANNNIFSPRRRDPSDRINNPYSFARFIQNPEQSTRAINVQGELPDFVQDHFTSTSSSNGLNSDHNQRNGLPDFTHHTTIDLNQSRSNSSLPFYNHRSELNLSHPSYSSSSSSSSGDELINSTSNNEMPRLLAVSNSANLPDFLSDTGIGIIPSNESILPIICDNISSNSVNSVDGIVAEPGDNVVLSARIVELEEENAQKSLRIRQLEQQINENKRKEEEETEIMATMMRQVDENLARAVERWQNSEREVERLNSRIHQLELQLSRASSNGSFVPMHLVRDFGAQLESDLIAADEIIKQFMEHSDRLKLLAGHLQFLDRVKDISQSDADHTPT